LGRTPALLFWLFIVSGVIFLAYAVQTGIKAAAVYEGGLAFRKIGGVRAWPWPHLTGLYVALARERGILTRTRHRDAIDDSPGERATFDDRFEKVTELGALLSRRMVDQYYSPAAARFNAGEAVNFGELSLDQNELRLKGRSAAWEGIEWVSVRRGYC